MISSLLVSVFFAAAPDVGGAITEARRAFIEDGDDRVSATPTHRVVSHADGSLELQGAQSLRFSLQAVRREGAKPCRATVTNRVVDERAPRTLHTQRACALEERWTNGREGLEQTFILQRPPAGTGALTLSLSVRGPWHHHDVNGQVFSGPGAVDALRYGNAFVVRAGRKLPIEVTHVEGGLELKVPRELVEAPGAFPMIIDPVVSTEVPLNPTLTGSVPLPGNEHSPAIALNGMGQPMVVWVDDRRQIGTDIFGARLSSSGALLDPQGIAVATDRLRLLEPTLCGDDNGWLVAFVSETVGGYQVRAVRVDVNGVPAAPFDIDSGREPSLAAKGSTGDSLIAYVEPSGGVVVTTITSSNLQFLEGSSDSSQSQGSHPSIAATDSDWTAVFESTVANNPSAIRALSPSLLGAIEQAVSPASSVASAAKPVVAYGGSLLPGDAVYVYWEQGTDVAGKRLGSAAAFDEIFTGARSPALTRFSNVLGSKPTLGFFVQNRLSLVDLANTGVLPPGLSVNARAKDLAVAANGMGGLFATWSEDTALGSDVWATFFSGGFAQPTVIAKGTPPLRLEHVAFAEGVEEGLAVWVEGAGVVLGARARLEDDGGVAIASPFSFATTAGVVGLDVAASDADGGYLTVWRTADGGVQGMISDLDRPLSGALTINLPGANAGPSVAWDEFSANWVVAWGQAAVVTGPETRTVSRTSSLGTIIVRGMQPISDLDLTCVNGKCLLATERSVTRDVQISLFTPAATSVGTPITTAGTQPVVAHDGTDFVFGYRTPGGFNLVKVGSTNGAQSFIVGVPPSLGSRLGSLSLAPGHPPVMAWSEFDATSGLSSIFLERVTSPLGGSRNVVADGVSPSLGSRGLAADPVGVLVYGRFDADPTALTLRGWGRRFDFGEGGTIDAGVMDAGVIDAGLDDAGFRDAGADAGIDDAGVDDAGPGLDAGFEAPDAGAVIFTSSGCTCQSSASAPLALALFLLLRRRR